MDAIIIHNSFEISISLSPRIRRNDSSSNCMTGHPSRPQSKLATLVNHSGHPRPFEVQIPRHVSEWRRNEHLGTMPRSVPICFSFPPGLILLVERKKREQQERTINHHIGSSFFPPGEGKGYIRIIRHWRIRIGDFWIARNFGINSRINFYNLMNDSPPPF